jgi:hypothetical protein
MGQAPPAPSCENVAPSGPGWCPPSERQRLLEVTRDRRASLETSYPWTRPASPMSGGPAGFHHYSIAKGTTVVSVRFSGSYTITYVHTYEAPRQASFPYGY